MQVPFTVPDKSEVSDFRYVQGETNSIRLYRDPDTLKRIDNAIELHSGGFVLIRVQDKGG